MTDKKHTAPNGATRANARANVANARPWRASTVSIGERLTIRQAAPICNVSEYTLRKWCREGRIPAKKLGNDWGIFESDLLQCLEPDNQPVEVEAEDAWSQDPALTANLKTKAMKALDILGVRTMEDLANLDTKRVLRLKGYALVTVTQIQGARKYARAVLGMKD